MPEILTENLSLYLDAVYSCQNLTEYQDVNTMLGFKFAADSKPHINNNKYVSEKPFDAADLVDTDMKEEMDTDEDNLTSHDDEDYTVTVNGINHGETNHYKSETTPEQEPQIKIRNGSKTKITNHEKRKKRSKIWDNFTPDEENSDNCFCNKCNELVIIKNVKCRIQVLESHYKYCQSGIPQPSNGSRPKRSKVWKYYIVDPTNPALCVCQICQETVSYKNQVKGCLLFDGLYLVSCLI